MLGSMTNSSVNRFTIERLNKTTAIATAAATRAYQSRGFFYEQGGACAAYWMHWTVKHLSYTGVNLDLVLGIWGEGTTAP